MTYHHHHTARFETSGVSAHTKASSVLIGAFGIGTRCSLQAAHAELPLPGCTPYCCIIKHVSLLTLLMKDHYLFVSQLYMAGVNSHS
jgi:hypothetical protein